MISKLNKATFLMLAFILGLTFSTFAQDSAGEPGTFKKDNKSTTTGKGSGDGDINIGKKNTNPTTQKNNTGILFPEVEGWQRSEKTVYPQSGLGYSYSYDSPEGGRVTIYVYDNGVSGIPDGASNSAVKSEFDDVKKGLPYVYPNIKEVKTETITLGGANGKVKSLYSLFYMNANGKQFATEVYLFGYKNNFIKIRATRPKDAEKSAELNSLLAKFDSMFAS